MRVRCRPRHAAGLAALAAAGLALAGCGSIDSSEADLQAGKRLFIQSCGSCHTLQDAGTSATIGPNLDDAFRASRDAGLEETQFAGVTRRWIEIAQAPMPRNLVVGQDADDVAAYVATVAGLSPRSVVRPPPNVDQAPRDATATIDATPSEPDEGE